MAEWGEDDEVESCSRRENSTYVVHDVWYVVRDNLER
jgi:hypothetical protein